MRSLIGAAVLAACLGLASTTVQILVIREQLIALTGNEMSVAVTIASWIIAAAAGSLLVPRAITPGASCAWVLLIIAGLAAPFQVVLVRALHAWVSPFGEMVGPGAMIVLAAGGVFPSAMAIGGLFVTLVERARQAGVKRPAGFVYGLEGLGSAVAGLLLSAWLLGKADPVTIAGIAGLVAAAAALYLSLSGAFKRSRRPLAIAAACLLVLAAAVGAGRRVDSALRQIQWAPLKVEASVDSKYGNLVVASRDSLYDFFETGSLVFTIPDRLYAEEAAHIPLLHHPEPCHVLVVGGAGAGVIGEIVKHGSVRRIDYVDTDPVMISSIRDFAPPGWMDGTATASVRFIYDDARRYVAETRDMYDVVILNVPRPTSLQANRYYTVEFFRAVERILDRNGLVAVKIAAGGAYLGPETAGMIGTVAEACRAAFPMVATVPGDYVHVLASPGLDLTRQTGMVLERLKRRGIDAAFVNRFVLWDRLAPPKIAELDSVVAASGPRGINSDLRPVSLALALSFWEKQMSGARVISGLASRVTGPVAILALLGAGVAVALLSAGPRGGRRAILPGAVALYSTGLVTMATQILTIFALQTACGYIYTRIAALVASFMAGMGLASLLASVRGPAKRRPYLPELLQVALAAPPVLAVVALRALSPGPGGGTSGIADLVFSAISFLAGALGGWTFAVVSEQITGASVPAERAASACYWADLAGATVAGLATGLVMIPALGIAGCAYSIAGFSLLVAAALTALRRASPRPLLH